MTTKTPFVVHCGQCNHEWAALYSPMILTTAAAIAGSLRCPMCAADNWNIFTGPAPVDEINTSSERVKKTGEG